VMVEIGETYYDAGRYKEAIKAYNEAIGELPALADTIKSQISRSERSIRRDKIAYVCWGISALICGMVFLRKPRRIDMSRVVWSVAVFVLAGVFLSFGAWVIREQFTSAREMILIVISFSAITGLSVLISMIFTGKILAKSNADSKESHCVFPAVAGTLLGVVFFLAGIYLAIYHIYIHYLIVVKL